MAKEKKKAWYLHIDYIDNWGLQHSLKYKMPKDFQDGVAAIKDKPESGRVPFFTYE